MKVNYVASQKSSQKSSQTNMRLNLKSSFVKKAKVYTTRVRTR